jgi:hypothetical protein
MGHGLTKLGEKVLAGEDERAWQEIDHDLLRNVAGRHSIARTWREIGNARSLFAQDSPHGLRDIHALVLYRSLNEVNNTVVWSEEAARQIGYGDHRSWGPSNFSTTSLEILERYLVVKGYLDEDVSEDGI